jgi:hypothetical protein
MIVFTPTRCFVSHSCNTMVRLRDFWIAATLPSPPPPLRWKKAGRKRRSCGVLKGLGWTSRQEQRRPIKNCSIEGIKIAKGPMPHFLSCFSFSWWKNDVRSRKRRVQFVKAENPFHLNERLTAQQGLFLCPADLESSFVDNLTAMSGWQDNVVKLCLELDSQSAKEFARNLKSMNLSFTAMFPGLEGFARSIGQQMLHYRYLERAGLPPTSD